MGILCETESFLTACISLVHEPAKPSYTNSPKELRRNSSPIGHNNTKHFLCPVGSRHLFEFLEIARWQSVRRGSSTRTWKLSSRPFSRPDWLPRGLRGCAISGLRPVHTYPFSFQNATFSLRIRLSSTPIRWKRSMKTNFSKTLSRMELSWKRCFRMYVWTDENGTFRNGLGQTIGSNPLRAIQKLIQDSGWALPFLVFYTWAWASAVR